MPMQNGQIVYTHVIEPVPGADYNILQVLYETITDPAEQKNVIQHHPDIAERLQAYIESAREDLGDSRRGLKGKNVRPIGEDFSQ